MTMYWWWCLWYPLCQLLVVLLSPLTLVGWLWLADWLTATIDAPLAHEMEKLPRV